MPRPHTITAYGLGRAETPQMLNERRVQLNGAYKLKSREWTLGELRAILTGSIRGEFPERVR
jgi:hypothetical protein